MQAKSESLGLDTELLSLACGLVQTMILELNGNRTNLSGNTERSKWLDGSIGNTGGRTEIAEGRPTLFVEWSLATETQEWKLELSISVCSGDEPVLGLLVDICLRELEIEYKRDTKRLERYQLEFVLLEVARWMKGLETELIAMEAALLKRKSELRVLEMDQTISLEVTKMCANLPKPVQPGFR